MTFHSDGVSATSYAELRVVALPPDDLSVLEAATFIYDLNLLYELEIQSRLDPESLLFATPWILARNGRSTPKEAALRARRIAYGSPIELLADVPLRIASGGVVAAALWAVVQTLSKIYDLPENHKLLVAKRKLAELEVGRAEQIETHVVEDNATPAPRSRSFNALGAAERRLVKSRVRIVEIEIEVHEIED